MDYNRALASLQKWAEANQNVRAVVMSGSGAAGDAHPLSDRDIEIYAQHVDALLTDESWWSNLGDVLVVERLENGDGHPTRLAYYAGGKLDFTLVPADQLAGKTYPRPYRVLLDKDGQGGTLQLSRPCWATPSQPEFAESINWAYAAALMCAKACVRDELWAAKFRDQDLKARLLQMIEWDHRARYGPDYDTRHLGTRMTTWMDPEVRDELLSCWGHLDAVDTATALRSTIKLFAALAARTAAVWGFADFDHGRLASEIETILAQRPSLT